MWYLTAQPVVTKVQPFQVGEAAQLRRYLSVQLVVSEAHSFQVGEVADLRRYRPAQLISVEIQSGHTALVVSEDTVPLLQRFSAQPVRVVIPIRAASGVVDEDKRLPFGQGLPRDERRRHGSRGTGHQQEG